jgi:hypothetical protein
LLHLPQLDDVIRAGLDSVVGDNISGDRWKCAARSIAQGGIGIIRAKDIGRTAYHASIVSTSSLVAGALSRELEVT